MGESDHDIDGKSNHDKKTPPKAKTNPNFLIVPSREYEQKKHL
jgi:hypothetical protein